MKATVHTRHAVVEVEGDTQSELFKEMASVQEVFGEPDCGICSHEDIRMVVRRNKEEDDFFELQCQKQGCRGYLAFGQNKKGGGLFPIRKLTEGGKPDRERGDYKFGNKTRGWTKYRGEPKAE